MTDDFQLFPDQDDGHAVDADVALITAYLARELSLVQIVAVEDRLANDRAFRDKVRPILDAWVSPTPMQAGHAGERPLSREEVEAGWERYANAHAELEAHDGPRLVVGGVQPKRRKISMTRIAAGIAAITLPIVTLAQVAVYASKHPDAPGHSVAKELVSPFVEPLPAPSEQPRKPLPSPVDVRVGQQLEKPTPDLQPGAVAQVQAPIAETVKPKLGISTPSTRVRAPEPNREKIAAFAKQHMPEVIRGDTNATYMVMVLDQGDNYVWGTHGTGSALISVGGDRRTAAERRDFQRSKAIEYSGPAVTARDTSATAGRGGGGRMGGMIIRRDTNRALAASGGGGGGGVMRASVQDTGLRRVMRQADTALWRLDSMPRLVATRTGGADTARAMLTPVGGGGGGGRGGGFAGVAGPVNADWIDKSDSTSYTIVVGRIGTGQALNTAAGLQEPRIGESGIQGVKSAWLTMGETYTFPAGQLARQSLRVMVVHLAPGTVWKGR